MTVFIGDSGQSFEGLLNYFSTFCDSIIIFKMKFFEVYLAVDLHLHDLELVFCIVRHRILWKTHMLHKEYRLGYLTVVIGRLIKSTWIT